jgi:lipid-A-disaccharide synthase
VTQPTGLLVVAGEGSGDRLAAPVLERLNVPSFGLGGPAMAAQGCRLVADQSDVAAMGLGSVVARAGRLVRAWQKLGAAIRSERPRVSLLVGFSEFNARLAPRLRRGGSHVLWYAPPQIWAWRPSRGSRLSRSSDALALTLPFEQAIWARWGARAHYVGHPALELRFATREVARTSLGTPPTGDLVALLPGSREQEVRGHLPLLLDAFAELARRRPGIGAAVIVAPCLRPEVGTWVARRARKSGLRALALGVPELLPAFDLALAVSGTVTLEAALARVPPVIVYRPGPIATFWARRELCVPYVGLPNLVLGEPAFPELLAQDARADRIGAAAHRLLEDRSRAIDACDRVRGALGRGIEQPPSARVADLIAPWL